MDTQARIERELKLLRAAERILELVEESWDAEGVSQEERDRRIEAVLRLAENLPRA